MWIVSSMCQSVNSSWNKAVQNAVCVFSSLCGEHKNDFRL